MLGCQDFCGYYDWTFGYVRKHFGQQAVHELWSAAVGREAQAHYLDAAQREGLAGLYHCWVATGEDEHCDWTFTLDEPRNVLRWDMRKCPSKGFLLEHDLNADEDYCDHCMGWSVPLLERAGVEIVAHEHNHCGQCWAEMKLAGKPFTSPELDIDIRKDPRWGRGFIDRWEAGRKVPTGDPLHARIDACDVLEHWFASVDRLLLLGTGRDALTLRVELPPHDAVVVTDLAYVDRDLYQGNPRAVLIGTDAQVLPRVAARFQATPPDRRPLLMHAFLPDVEPLNFVEHDLPRPIPILPLLIRGDLYSHHPFETPPTNGDFLILLAKALKKHVQTPMGAP